MQYCYNTKMDDKQIIKIFASNLRAERARKDYTQEQLAIKANISAEYLNRIEKEKFSPSLIVIAHLAMALEVDLNTLCPIHLLK